MFGRLARYAIPQGRLDEALDSFRGAARELHELDGFVDGYLLVDADEGMLVTLTLWEDRRALEASAMRAAALRTRAVRAVDGSCESVSEYEVGERFGA